MIVGAPDLQAIYHALQSGQGISAEEAQTLFTYIEQLEQVTLDAHDASIGDSHTLYPWEEHPLHTSLAVLQMGEHPNNEDN